MKADRVRVFMDIEIKRETTQVFSGRITFTLFNKELPITCENFRSLCVGDNENKYCYKKSPFHRIITDFMAQGGDFTRENGTGGMSIYGSKFKDEGFPFKHTKGGQLSMANAGPNTNGSQFFLTFIPCKWLDGKHVVFGEMEQDSSSQAVLKALQDVSSESGKPTASVRIADCGQL